MSEFSDISPEDWAAWRALLTMTQQLNRALDRQLQSDAGISRADYAVLLTLFEAPEKRLRAGVLGEVLGWEKSRVSHQLTRMEARGLVRRLACDTDGRGTWISVTAAGRRSLLGAMRKHVVAIREYFFDVVTPEQREVVGDVASRVLERLQPEACDLAEDAGLPAVRGPLARSG